MMAESNSRAYLLVSQMCETEWVCLHSGRMGVWDDSWALAAVGLPWPVLGAIQGSESFNWKSEASQGSCWHLDCLSLQGWNWLGISHIEYVGGFDYPREPFGIPNVLGVCQRHQWDVSGFWFLHSFPS